MTDSNEENGGLPTAAIEEKCVECGRVDYVYSTDYEGRGSNCSNPESKDQELVRRSDVKALIQDKIQEFESEHEEIIECEEENHDHEIEEPMVIGRRQGLEVLLEELEK